MNTNLPFWLQPESRRLEFKAAWPRGDQVARTAAAFANGAGGRIVFGVQNEPRKIIGIMDGEIFSLEERAANHIFDLCVPSIIPEIYIQNVEGTVLLVVEIFYGFQKPYYLKSGGKHKGTYVRVGSVNRLASEETLLSLERSRRKISFDEVVVNEFTADQIDLEKFRSEFSLAAGKKIDTAKIECARFKGKDTRVFLDQNTIEGPIHTAVEPCLSFIKRNIALGSRSAWGTGIQKMRSIVADYPEIRLELGEVGHAFQVRFIKIETKVTPEVTPEVRLLVAVSGEMTRKALQDALDLKDEEHFRKTYLIPALDSGFIEMTIPDKPRSSRQKYRLTKKGQEAVKQWQK